MELPRLVDLCSKRLALNIEYDPMLLKGSVTLRLGAGVTDEELWTLTNRLLASRGFTTIQQAGEGTVSVVKLADAAALARVEAGPIAQARAGFVRVIRPLQLRNAKDLIESLAAVLSKPGGAATPLAAGRMILVADLKPHVEQAMALLDRLDSPGAAERAVEIPVRNVKATEVVALVERVTAARAASGGETRVGKVLASPDEGRVVIVAPASEEPAWRALVAQFDQRPATSTETYVPKVFAAREVARLLEEIVRGSTAPGVSEGFRVVVDDLTGSLVVTATSRQHDEVKALLERLDSASGATGRPMRSFSIRNRSVEDVLQVLHGLLESGALENGAAEGASKSAAAAPPPATNPGQLAPPSSMPSRTVAAGGVLTLTADKGTNTLIAVGEIHVLDQVAQLLARIDVRQPQVLLEALVVTLSDTETIALGVELQKVVPAGDADVLLASLFGLGSPDVNAAALPAASGAGGSAVVLNPGNFSAIVRALETITKGRALTIPKVLVNNNQQAKLDSVLQSPFASTNASTTVATTSFGGTLDAGTVITVRPQITEADHLMLEYTVALSSFVGTSANPALPPPRQQNSLSSVVAIPDGYTVVVGGLDSANVSETISKVPILGSIPLLGLLFGNRSTTDTTNRFYVFLRASILRHSTFEDLRYASDGAREDIGLEDGAPELEPILIR